MSERHGMAYTRLHAEWRRMKERCELTKCSNQNAKKYYIDKGITVCLAWRKFTAFAKWALANGYNDSLSLDRKNGSRNYQPSNCRWVSMRDNLRNRADRKLSVDAASLIRWRYAVGETQQNIAADYGVSQSAISKVINNKRWAA